MSRSTTEEAEEATGLLGMRLEWKLVLANAAILLLGLAVWTMTYPTVAESAGRTWGLILLLLAVSATLNTGLVFLAVAPIQDLGRTAQRVRAGDWAARTPPSPLADPTVDQLRILMNDILDQVSARDSSSMERSLAVVRAEERERGRISGEMYGETAQTLAALLLQLKMLERLAREGADLDATSERFGHAIRDVLEGVRSIARRLRPPELEELGLRTAVEAHVRHLREREGAPSVTVVGELPDDRLDPDVRLTLFRTVEIALENALDHARASAVEVLLRSDTDHAVIQVCDDGCGFDTLEVDRGLGIPAMVERARVAGGRVAIDSAPGRGTCVTVELPWFVTPMEERPASVVDPVPL